MITLTMRYPGDPPMMVERMSREEFFERFPPDIRVITIGPLGGPPTEVTPMGDLILCDSCNENAGEEINLIGNSRVKCAECFKQIARYCS